MPFAHDDDGNQLLTPRAADSAIHHQLFRRMVARLGRRGEGGPAELAAETAAEVPGIDGLVEDPRARFEQSPRHEAEVGCGV